MRSLLSLIKGINSVDAPNASQIANPNKQAIPLLIFKLKSNFYKLISS
jgi:hypothetical protein